MVWERAERRKERADRKEQVNGVLQMLQMAIGMLPIFQNMKNRHRYDSSDEEGEANVDKKPVDPGQFLGKFLVRVGSGKSHAGLLSLTSITECIPRYSEETGILEQAFVKTTDGQAYIVFGSHPAQCLLDALNYVSLNHVVMFKHIEPEMYRAIFADVAAPAAQEQPGEPELAPSPAQA